MIVRKWLDEAQTVTADVESEKTDRDLETLCSSFQGLLNCCQQVSLSLVEICLLSVFLSKLNYPPPLQYHSYLRLLLLQVYFKICLDSSHCSLWPAGPGHQEEAGGVHCVEEGVAGNINCLLRVNCDCY